MTRSTNARVAGFAFLFYIAVAFPSMVLFARATSGEGAAAKLATFAQHAADVRLALVLSFLGCLSALVLAVTLYAVTRDQDSDIAMLGLTCRVAEGVTGAVTIPVTFALLALATLTGPGALNSDAMQALSSFVFEQNSRIGELFFAIGSTSFAWLLLRGRLIPRWLAWVGFLGSAVLVIELLLRAGGVVGGLVTQLIWIPVAVFELTLGPWFLIKGVRVVA